MRRLPNTSTLLARQPVATTIVAGTARALLASASPTVADLAGRLAQGVSANPFLKNHSTVEALNRKPPRNAATMACENIEIFRN